MRWQAALAMSLVSAAGMAQAPFCAQIQALTAASPAQWGVSVQTLDGTTLCAVNEAKLFRPASNAKLFTSSTALDVLGPDKTFETRVTGKLDPATGVVTGDLTLAGGGDANLDSGDLPYVFNPHYAPDPNFAFHDLDDLAAQLVARGVKRVAGGVVGDDTLFPYEPYGDSWEYDDLVWGFGAPVSALSIADNHLPLTITPGKQGSAATVVLNQHGIDYYTLAANVETRAARASLAGVQVERKPGTKTLYVSGSIAEDARPDVEEVAIDDPAEYAAMAFRASLQVHGIEVQGAASAKHRLPHEGAGFLLQLRAPGGAEPDLAAGSNVTCPGSKDAALAIHRSAPLAQDLVFTNKVSQNLHAELLLHAVGSKAVCGGGSTVEGARRVRAFLLHAGIAADDFLLYDGSGLSGHDLVTPRSLTRLMVYDAKQPWFPQLKAALPVGGIDGSLSLRFVDDLKGKVFAKTGTLGETRTLTGYVTASSGRMIAFSIMDDNHPPSSVADRLLMDKLVGIIAAGN